MIFKLLLFFTFIVVYFHIYHCFKVNPNNEIQHLNSNDIQKNFIDREVLYKLPFYFDHKVFDISNTDNAYIQIEKASKKNSYIDIYSKPYKKMKLIEPNILFETKNIVYKFPKERSHIGLHENISFRNFYIIHEGVANVIIVHPSYKDLFVNDGKLITTKKSIEFLKNNENFIFIELHKNSILYVPNYWLVFVEQKKGVESNLELEKIEYIPFVNKLNFLYNNMTNNQNLNE